mgnify:CR=1 FL=1
MLKDATTKNITNKPRRRKRKKTKYTAEFVDLFNGIQRCIKCGFAMAPGEEKMHSSYHSSYEKYAKQVIKDDEVDIIYSYTEFLEKEKEVENLKELIKLGDESSISLDVQYETLIDMLVLLEYNASIRFYDFNKEHPRISEYRTLLFNTPLFISKLSEVIPQKYLEDKVRESVANRKIKTSLALSDDYIIFIGVEESYDSEILERIGFIDLSHLDSLNNNETEYDIEEVESLEEVDIEESLNWLSRLIG